MEVSQLIQQLDLLPHPEGGFYKEVYRSPHFMKQEGFAGKRSVSTSIYYLLQAGDFSAFHRIKSDELWHFYSGGPLIVHMLEEGKGYSYHLLGSPDTPGAVFQAVVPAYVWFASEPLEGTDYTLAGCTVAPGFDFADFELAHAASLLQQFPEQATLINRLCR
ncbi:MAG TPA: cupin domain-containing protein [Flavisolibacter sp.]|jgi:hypothetical protein|nr:cupin domain-containing protein [Flavisolibacter sp.]